MKADFQSLILIVDDNEDILFHLKLLLEDNNYIVKTAVNGNEALKLLSKLKSPPDLIVSDIMMPVMNGHDFFTAVSNTPQWNRIPFLFLTAKSTPEDIRLGKMLGVDDYITKPFKKEDLLASISGKIARNKKSALLDKEIKELLTKSNIETQLPLLNQEKPSICLLFVYWDDKMGPIVDKTYHSDENLPFSIDIIGNQLFHAATSIYGHDKITAAQGILLNIENIQNKGYLFFDSYPDENERFKEKQYMLAIITPKLTYIESLKVKEILKEISEKIKINLEWEIEEYWQKIFEVIKPGTPLIENQ
ncbi:MAG: PleD family two-component system response regulator [Candidatus Thorarchaeota archaeon]